MECNFDTVMTGYGDCNSNGMINGYSDQKDTILDKETSYWMKNKPKPKKHAEKHRVRFNYPEKITDILLEDETLTLWRPAITTTQYCLIPESILEEHWPNILQVYYTKFDCVSSVMPFDDAIKIIAHQSTTILPTQDYSVLRDFPRIRGLWYKPDKSENIGLTDESRIGNVKFSFSFPKSEKENLLSQLNMYYLEVMDYQSEHKSVSRFLLTKSKYNNLPLYDVHKPGGPIYVRKNETLEGITESYFFLKTCRNFQGKIVDHIVEFMLEEDPWPLCQLSTTSHIPFKKPEEFINFDSRDFGRLHTGYLGANWDRAMAGMFVWALQSKVPWLVYERLHENIKSTVNLVACEAPLEEIFTASAPILCKRLLDLLVELYPFIAKCHNDQDLAELLQLFKTIHMCDDQCIMVSLKYVDIPISRILNSYLALLEKVIASCSFSLKQAVISTLLPWSILAYHYYDHKIDSCRKMVAFISQIDELSCKLLPGNGETRDFLHSASTDLTGRTSGFASMSSYYDEDEDESLRYLPS
ncbi:uncharacterized protein [Mytilus edulis]|uniref:uncharacterized protein n=1 Tax=Mytilus edulis TaxID=6550 RepID=UPI0039F0207B